MLQHIQVSVGNILRFLFSLGQPLPVIRFVLVKYTTDNCLCVQLSSRHADKDLPAIASGITPYSEFPTINFAANTPKVLQDHDC